MTGVQEATERMRGDGGRQGPWVSPEQDAIGGKC
jgi:hypothetical protein